MLAGDCSDSRYHVAISTTGPPDHDWCGISGKKIRGVADMFVWSAKATVIGEVKGVGTKSAAAVCQVIAEMQTLMEMDDDGTWPIGKYGLMGVSYNFSTKYFLNSVLLYYAYCACLAIRGEGPRCAYGCQNRHG